MENKIKVQVVCVTYNQKDYIREALDSFLMQKTNFKFEVLVGDDCSTDGTSEIVAEYAQKYPDIIKHIRRAQNMGCLANFMDLCEKADAKYVAFCDGDDYWTDENKLQKQYDFMEKNEDVNICAHKTFIKADRNWSLYDYYAKQKIPFVVPARTASDKKLTVKDIITDWPHTSGLFIRWTKINYPEWTKTDGVVGDIQIIFLHLGNKHLYILNEVMSVYRRGNSGVFNCTDTKEEHFLRTRTEYFKNFSGLIEYFKQNYNSFEVSAFESRLWTEIINYANAIIKTDRWEKLTEIQDQYPDVYEKIKTLLSEYKFRVQQIKVLGKKNADLLRKNSELKKIKSFLERRQPKLNFKNKLSAIKSDFKKTGNKILSFSAYWIFALIPKKKNLWVFSGFFKKNYMDNTKYLYEYIVKNHPEIEAVWLTRNKEVRKNLRKSKMPVHRMNSLIGIWTMARASVAFSDHFKMSDYDNRYGFNARTKFVNLWHGVGLKDMRPVNGKLKNTTINGVELSNDIIVSKEDNFSNKLKKCFKYPFVAPFREMFEKYYMIVCPGQQFIDYNVKPWHIPDNAQFLCGYPRTEEIFKNRNRNNKPIILYAPTYRWKQEDEKKLIKNFIDNIPLINNFLEKIDGEFVLRLHPHTWRNYEKNISDELRNYPRFSISNEKDIYKSLFNYSLMITDYSSIAYDFLLTEKPLVFLAMDYKECCSGDYNFQMDYKEYCPGDITYSWQEALESAGISLENPNYNKELRQKILNIFTPPEYNTFGNSQRITEHLKEKLKIRKD